VKIKFDSNQDFQLDAIRSVVDVFAGQPPMRASLQWQSDVFAGELLTEMGIGNSLVVAVDIFERVRTERHDVSAAFGPTFDRLLDVCERDSTDHALVLGEDDIGCQRLQRLGIDLINRQPRSTRLLTLRSISRLESSILNLGRVSCGRERM